MKYPYIIIFCLLNIGGSAAQTEGSDFYIEQLIENTAAENENKDIELIYEQLNYMKAHPIDLNAANAHELENCPFFTTAQIEAFLAYRYRYGKLYALFELKLIQGFTAEFIQNILPFIAVNKIQNEKKFSLKKCFKYGKNQLLWRSDFCLQEKLAYKEKKYLGSPWYTYFKYKFMHPNLSFGISMEKDAGEPLDWKFNKGFDFYSAHVMINNLWKFKKIVIGDYKLNFGQGLVFHSTRIFGKTTNTLNIAQRLDGIGRYSSIAEYGYFRGVAATFAHKNIEATAFVSSTKTDKLNGLHRQLKDFEKKNTYNQHSSGGNLQYFHKYFKLGISGVCSYQNDAYNFTVGLDYRFRIHKFNFSGEIAFDHQGKIANLHTLSFYPNSRMGCSILYRNYPIGYEAPFSNAFAESNGNDEEGIFLSTYFLPLKHWKISIYTDIYKHKWMKYLVNKPSYGYEAYFRVEFTPKSNQLIYAQYKFEQKNKNEIDYYEVTKKIYAHNKHEIKIQYQGNFGEKTVLKSGIYGSIYSTQTNDKSFGILLFQDIEYNFIKIPLKINMRYSFFDAQNYNNRIYAYEKDILHSFSIPMYYGQGNRIYFNMVYSPLKNLKFYARISNTYYTHKEGIGSGLEYIEGNNKTDLHLLVSYKF